MRQFTVEDNLVLSWILFYGMQDVSIVHHSWVNLDMAMLIFGPHILTCNYSAQYDTLKTLFDLSITIHRSAAYATKP